MEGAKTIQFRAEMTCEGCSGAITRILNGVEGVSDIECSIPDQIVTCKAAANIDAQDLLAKLKEWGEAAERSVELMA